MVTQINPIRIETGRPTLGPSPCTKESELGGYGSLNMESSLDTTCHTNRSHQQEFIANLTGSKMDQFRAETLVLTSASLCLLATSSCVGECGLLAGAPLTESSSPLGSSLGLLVALGFTLLLLAGGEGGLAFTGGSAE